ncbi:hypothetical protein [Pararhizobium sp. PWRC1-1]|uniref:hypothetical protein n=1 Tax=Pararhizobium sp. PWRC1-1 TaxID=2804566 RepID=UPI003CE90D72
MHKSSKYDTFTKIASHRIVDPENAWVIVATSLTRTSRLVAGCVAGMIADEVRPPDRLVAFIEGVVAAYAFTLEIERDVISTKTRSQRSQSESL